MHARIPLITNPPLTTDPNKYAGKIITEVKRRTRWQVALKRKLALLESAWPAISNRKIASRKNGLLLEQIHWVKGGLIFFSSIAFGLWFIAVTEPFMEGSNMKSSDEKCAQYSIALKAPSR